MTPAKSTSQDEFFFSVAQAKWVIGVLSMVISVVGRDSLLGLILRQTRSEINSIVRDEEPEQVPDKMGAAYQNN